MLAVCSTVFTCPPLCQVDSIIRVRYVAPEGDLARRLRRGGGEEFLLEMHADLEFQTSRHYQATESPSRCTMDTEDPKSACEFELTGVVAIDDSGTPGMTPKSFTNIYNGRRAFRNIEIEKRYEIIANMFRAFKLPYPCPKFRDHLFPMPALLFGRKRRFGVTAHTCRAGRCASPARSRAPSPRGCLTVP